MRGSQNVLEGGIHPWDVHPQMKKKLQKRRVKSSKCISVTNEWRVATGGPKRQAVKALSPPLSSLSIHSSISLMHYVPDHYVRIASHEAKVQQILDFQSSKMILPFKLCRIYSVVSQRLPGGLCFRETSCPSFTKVSTNLLQSRRLVVKTFKY